jgi:hypothetical protein
LRIAESSDDRNIEPSGWQLPLVVYTPFQGIWLWCQLNVHGHLAEFLVDTLARDPSMHFVQMYNLQAFMRLAPTPVLLIEGSTNLATNTESAIHELFQIIESAQISSHP